MAYGTCDAPSRQRKGLTCFSNAPTRRQGRLAEFVRNRYRSWDAGIGKKIESGKTSFKTLETYMLKKGEVTKNERGRQEFLENLINEFI